MELTKKSAVQSRNLSSFEIKKFYEINFARRIIMILAILFVWFGLAIKKQEQAVVVVSFGQLLLAGHLLALN